MLKLKRMKDRKAQNTAEYAILIALVVGAVIAMQTYVQRGMNGRFLDTTKFMINATKDVGSANYQYEPYYQDSKYKTNRFSDETLQAKGENYWSTKTSKVNRLGQENAVFDRSGTLTDY